MKTDSMTTDSATEWDAASGTQKAPRVRLAFGDVMRRVGLVVFLIEIMVFWRHFRVNRRWFRHPKRFLLLLLAAPRMLVFAFLIAALIAVLCDLLVRFMVQPVVRLWYNPRSEGSAASFHLGSGETMEESTPARRAVGRRWQAGTLARTNQRFWFFPQSWDAEPWSVPLGEVDQLRSEPAPRVGLGIVTGMPDRLSVSNVSGQTEQFAVAVPEHVLDWLDHCPRCRAKST
jgi:hypothetical protein